MTEESINMLYHLVTFKTGDAVRAKSVNINGPRSFKIITDKNETLLMHYTKILQIVPTIKSWKALKKQGILQAEII